MNYLVVLNFFLVFFDLPASFGLEEEDFFFDLLLTTEDPELLLSPTAASGISILLEESNEISQMSLLSNEKNTIFVPMSDRPLSGLNVSPPRRPVI